LIALLIPLDALDATSGLNYVSLFYCPRDAPFQC